ncbi:MAG: hypothetical protein ACREJO_18905 [Phycisphaerales bacterium]
MLSPGCRIGFCALGVAAALGLDHSAMGYQLAPSVQRLGSIPEGSGAIATSVSADGSVVGGITGIFTITPRTFRWSAATGMVPIIVHAGNQYGTVAVSGDGTTLASSGSFPRVPTGQDPSPSYTSAYQWTSGGGVQSLNLPPGAFATYASAINGDGSVIVGAAVGNGLLHSFRYTSGGGMQDIGVPSGYIGSHAHGVSGDGSVVAGAAESGPFANEAYSWTSAGGFHMLGVLPAGISSFAYAVSGDGHVVVGNSQTPGGTRAVRWIDSGPAQVIPDVGGGGSTPDRYALAVNQDGSVIVGSQNLRAFFWTQALGSVDLNTFLTSRGVNLGSLILTGATGVSADGYTLVGAGREFGSDVAWIATIPAPASPIAMMPLALFAIRRRR